ncbi:MAG: 6,7-dimethyl-8-ribityllumazine synthase [Vampirovibrionales bacterium]|nr:6,7-dimethyl-8-ribityllumazine synthase [Vampirovibrionales bacterium]
MSNLRFQSKSQARPEIPSFAVSTEGRGFKLAITVSRFNSHITEPLLENAYNTLIEQGVSPQDIDVAWVPGAFELPLASLSLAKTGKYAAIIALGCVIRGETTHYDYVCNESARGINEASLQSGVPIMFGVLTTENLEQAEARAGFKTHEGQKAENKGMDVALAALEMANLQHYIQQR